VGHIVEAGAAANAQTCETILQGEELSYVLMAFPQICVSNGPASSS